MACKAYSGQRAILPICAMSLRALPTDTLPGDHLALLDPCRWIEHNTYDEQCRCDRPHLEWCLTPLGAAVELRWGSANHRLCMGGPIPRLDLHPHAHAGIVAESLFVSGEIVSRQLTAPFLSAQ